MADTFADLLREAGLHPAALAPDNTRTPAPRPGLMRGGHTPSGQPYMGSPQFRARADAATAGMPAPLTNQLRDTASMAGELVGTEPLARGVMALRGDLTGRPEPGRAAGEFAMGGLNMFGTLGALGEAAGAGRAGLRPPVTRPASAPNSGFAGAIEGSYPGFQTGDDGRVVALFNNGAVRSPFGRPAPQAPAPMSSAPRWERATDGSVLPVRPQADRPFSRTAPTSADLREATQPPNVPQSAAPSAIPHHVSRVGRDIYEPSPGVEMEIAPGGRTLFTYRGRARPGGGAGAEGVRVFRGAYQALLQDIERMRALGNPRPEYSWRPETPRQAELYRNAMRNRALEGYYFTEAENGMMRLRRLDNNRQR